MKYFLSLAVILVAFGAFALLQRNKQANPPTSSPAAQSASKRSDATPPDVDSERPPDQRESAIDPPRPALATQIEEALVSGSAEDKRTILDELLGPLVAEDPPSAAALLAAIEPGPFRDEYLLRLGQLWAAQNPTQAVQWAAGLSDETERADALKTVSLEMGQTDPEGAIRILESMNVPNDRTTVEHLAQSWASKDESAAVTWALAQPSGERRDHIVSRIGWVMSETDPRQAAELIVKNVTPGATQTEAVISVVHQWGLKDWTAAKEWVDIFPEGPVRERAEQELSGIKAYGSAISKSAP